MIIPIALTIAASDPSGAAGLQADLKTFEARQVYGMSVVTGLSVQNSRGVQDLQPVEAAFIASQLQALLDDVNVAAIKTGLLLRAENVAAILPLLPAATPLVIDPVLVAGNGRRLVDDTMIQAYMQQLFPRATVITPNLDEASILTGGPVHDVPTMRQAAVQLHRYGSQAVLIKGGHLPATQGMIDVLYDGQDFHELYSDYLPVHNPRGTGCTLASCIASELAYGRSILEAAQIAKFYVAQTLLGALQWQIGSGRGTLFHSVDRPPIQSD